MQRQLLIATMTWMSICALQRSAHASGTCVFDGRFATLTVFLNGGASGLSVDAAGFIRLDGARCGASTVTNTDLVIVWGQNNAIDTLTVRNPERFVPGLTPEATGASEIEIDI